MNSFHICLSVLFWSVTNADATNGIGGEGEPMGNRSSASWEELRLKDDLVKASSPPMLVLDSLESDKKEEEGLSWKFLTSSRKKKEEEEEESRRKRGRLPDVRTKKKGIEVSYCCYSILIINLKHVLNRRLFKYVQKESVFKTTRESCWVQHGARG